MATLLASCTLTAPSSDPSISTGQSFTMTAALTWSGGHGGNEGADVTFEYSTTPGSGFTTIPASGTTLSTADTNPATGIVASPVSITVDGDGADTYYVRAVAAASSTFTSSEQTVTVSAGAITGTMAVTETGADTASASGDVLVAGDLAVTEVGADTADVSGEVLVAGDLSATEVGADSLAASGTVTDPAITGNLAATEVGADTAALEGGVLVEGALVASESATDGISASGSVLVSGDVIAAEGAADAASLLSLIHI